MRIDREMYLGPGYRKKYHGPGRRKTKGTWIFDGETLTVRGEGRIGRNHCRWAWERSELCALEEWRDFRDRVRHAVLEEGIRELGAEFFAGCRNLESVSLPESLIEIGDSAFKGCRSLRRVELPAGLWDLGAGAFENCLMLEEIEIPSGVKQLKEALFRNCVSLRRVKLNEGLEVIFDYVFAGCCLETLEIPRSVEMVWRHALRELRLKGECPGVEGLCADGVLYTMMVRNRDALFLSPKIRRIEICALSDVWSGVIFVPDSVTEIRSGAMQGSRVSSLYLGTGVTRLQWDLLYGCSSLSTVYIAGVLESVEDHWAGDGNKPRIITRHENYRILEDFYRGEGKEHSIFPLIDYLPEGNPAAVECEFYRREKGTLRSLHEAPWYPLTIRHIV